MTTGVVTSHSWPGREKAEPRKRPVGQRAHGCRPVGSGDALVVPAARSTECVKAVR